MSEQELKPCPFCGGEGELVIQKTVKPYRTEQYFIRCSACFASTMRVSITEEQRIYADETDTTIKTTTENIIKAWNKRAAERKM